VYDKYSDNITIYKYSNHALGHYVGIDHEQFWHDIISLCYHPEKEKQITSKYKKNTWEKASILLAADVEWEEELHGTSHVLH